MVKGLAAAPAGPQGEAMRASWLAARGLHVPSPLPYCFEVAGCMDADAPTSLVPACCVLTVMGFAQLPASAPEHLTERAALRLLSEQLLGDVGSAQLWGTLQPVAGLGPAGEGGAAGVKCAAAAAFSPSLTACRVLQGALLLPKLS